MYEMEPHTPPSSVQSALRNSRSFLDETSRFQVISGHADCAAPRYRDETLIGEGGVALIYRAIDARLRRLVALKRFRGECPAKLAEDYRSEMAAASLANHPNVMSILDTDHDENGRFIVMEFIDGKSAEDAISGADQVLGLHDFINFAIQSLEGLNSIHAGGLLHLDLKPSNIMISELLSGRSHVKIVDFGRSQLICGYFGRLPKGRGMNGSIHYSAPEQFLSGPLDVRTDLYALGAVFYWVLTGMRPFEGDDSIQVMAAHMQHFVTPLAEVRPSLPDWLANWVMSLIQIDPNQRPADVSCALDSLLKGIEEYGLVKIA